jgi:ribosomal 50S subunit-associated protein YjgA (DUF615 family)
MIPNTQVERIVSDIFKQRFANVGYLRSDVASDVDYDGSPIIRVTAHFAKAVTEFDAILASVNEIRTRLIQSGDERYVFLTPDYPGAADEKDDDADEPTVSGKPLQ